MTEEDEEANAVKIEKNTLELKKNSTAGKKIRE